MNKLSSKYKGIKKAERHKGTVNRITRELGDVLKDVVCHQPSKTRKLNKLNPNDRIGFLIKLIPVVYPKIKLDNENKL